MNRQHVQEYVASRRSPVCGYVYDLAQLRSRCQQLRAQLPAGCSLFYAVKANCDEPVLRTLLGVVDGFEVASLGEIEKVRAISPGATIVFGGPGKTDAELQGRCAMAWPCSTSKASTSYAGSIGLPGSAAKWWTSCCGSTRAHAPAQASLRMGGQPTQFGIAQDQLPAALAVAQQCRHVRVQGLHFYAVSNNLDAQAHLALIAHYLALASAWRDQHGLPLHWLNAGGGIGIDYADPAHSFDWLGFCQGLAPLLHGQPAPPHLVFECGRFLAAHCGHYVAEVIDLKPCFGRWFAILRGGSHHFRLPSSWQHDHPCFVIEREHWPYPFARPTTVGEPITLCGELCTPKDVLAREVPLPRLRVGDCIAFRWPAPTAGASPITTSSATRIRNGCSWRTLAHDPAALAPRHRPSRHRAGPARADPADRAPLPRPCARPCRGHAPPAPVARAYRPGPGQPRGDGWASSAGCRASVGPGRCPVSAPGLRAQVSVTATRDGYRVDPAEIVRRARTAEPYPPKTTRHAFARPLPLCNLSLCLLEAGPATPGRDRTFAF